MEVGPFWIVGRTDLKEDVRLAEELAALPDWIARADRLEALLRESRQAVVDGIIRVYGDPAQPRAVDVLSRLLERIDAVIEHGGDPTPPADDCGHSRGHSEEGDD